MIESPVYALAGAIFITALGIVAVKARAIDILGAITGGVISFLAFLAGGLQWLIIIVAFFAISSALTRYRFDYKQKMGVAQNKSGIRSWPNTLANGGVAGVAALLEIFLHGDVLAIAFLGSVAAAMSDTLGTEIGLLSRSMPRLITNLKVVVKPGTSGGISVLGEVAALVSAFAIAALGFLLKVPGSPGVLIFFALIPAVVIGAMSGTIIDSIIGAKFEGLTTCVVCGALTEDRLHHGQPAKIVRGSRVIDNNVVNFIGVLTGAAISVAIYLSLVFSGL